ncbi:MAG: tRNA dihydrouridine synthase DusB [Candidatus Rokubacteria bacterium]|nr:tRNA dihydrouridine synthase DusB [Candidatus Rokubacteria bacterium]MBI3826455.1 tRNA dihydrouridine synthase DusB [Candidatus Rokubacteria bacterium]
MLDLRLAPMAGVSNLPFRLVARECGAGLLTSEEVDARALVQGNAGTRAMLRHLPAERPLAMQLLGSEPEVLAEAARILEAEGADGVDLNMGCPVPKIVAKGHGAALMRDPLGAARALRAMRKAVGVPLTIKIRGGWDERTLNAVAIARLAEDEGVSAITVHPRTRSQQYTGRAPWEVIASVVDAVAIPVIGNGDVGSHADAAAMRTATGCAAVMIGRAALGRPWIFATDAPEREARAAIVRRHCDLIQGHLPERIALVQLKKHLAWYSTGLPGAALARPRLFQARNASEVKAVFWGLW